VIKSPEANADPGVVAAVVAARATLVGDSGIAVRAATCALKTATDATTR
jgi:hypothetical protein